MGDAWRIPYGVPGYYFEGVLTELHVANRLTAYTHAKQVGRQNGGPSAVGFCVVMDIIGVSPTLLSGDVLTHLWCNGKINAVHYPRSMH